MSRRRVVCRCCGRECVWREDAQLDEFDRDVGGRWVLASEAITSPWLAGWSTPHAVDPTPEAKR